MPIVKNRKETNSKIKNRIKTIQLKDNIQHNMKKIYSNEYYINCYNDNYLQIFDILSNYNDTLTNINNIKMVEIFLLFNLHIYPISNLPFNHITNYILYKLFKMPINLQPVSQNNFIYNSYQNIIEIDLEKYENQSYDIIHGFLKSKILGILEYKLKVVNILNNNLDNQLNLLKDMNIIILHNTHCLATNTRIILQSLIKRCYDSSLIRFIITSNQNNLINLNFFPIRCIKFNNNFLFRVYNIINNNIEEVKEFEKIDEQIYNSYSRNIDNHNILQFLLNIDYINYIRKHRIKIDKPITIIFEEDLYILLDRIMYNSCDLLHIIEYIKSYVQNIINYDVNYSLFVKLIKNYMCNIRKSLIRKDISSTIFNKFYTGIYKMCNNYSDKQYDSKFTHDFIVYETLLLSLYKMNLKYKLYDYLRQYKVYQLQDI